LLEQRLTQRQATFELSGRAGKDQLGINIELVAKLALPLFCQLGGTKHGHTTNFSAIEQFPRNKGSLDRFPNPDVVSDQQSNRIETECHQEWNQLVRARLDGEASKRAEGSGARPKAEAQCVTKQTRGPEIAQPIRARELEARRPDRLQWSVDARHFPFAATQRP
jgi:hypothetical protein